MSCYPKFKSKGEIKRTLKRMDPIIEILKPKPEPEFSWEDVDSLLKPQSVPPNSFTREQFQKRYNLSLSSSKRRLTKLVKQGKLKATSFMKTGNGQSCGAFYYTVVK